MKKDTLLKVLGVGATFLGFGATLLGNWVAEKNLDAQVTEKVAKAIAEQVKGDK